MSKNYWQIKKQSEQLRHGKSVTSRVEAYVQSWEGKCYFEGIPDSVSDKLLFSGRAPSYKAIALCILSNDMYLRRLGLSWEKTAKYREIMQSLEAADNGQADLFG